MSSIYDSELKSEVESMITIAEEKFKKDLDGCSFKYGTILYKMSDWIGHNSDLANHIEEWFKEKYKTVWEEIDNHMLCFNYKVVLEILDICELDDIIREIIE